MRRDARSLLTWLYFIWFSCDPSLVEQGSSILYLIIEFTENGDLDLACVNAISFICIFVEQLLI